MQFSTLFVSALASIATAYKVGVPFGIVAIRSGSLIQYSGFTLLDDQIALNGPTEFTGTFLDDGRIQVGDKFLTLSGEKLTLSSTGTAFSDDGEDHLTLGGLSFIARPLIGGGSKYAVLAQEPGSSTQSSDIPFAPRIMYRN